MGRWAIVAVFLLAACGGAAAPSQRLNGTWRNELVTMQFDFSAGAFTVAAVRGPVVNSKLELVRESGNTVVFLVDGRTLTAQLIGDDVMAVAEEGKAQQQLTRVK